MTNNTEQRRAFEAAWKANYPSYGYNGEDGSQKELAWQWWQAALAQRTGWIKCDDRMPDRIPGKDESEVVFGVVGGKVGVYQRQWSGDGWAWCRATGYHYGDLAKTECEFDDDYDVTHWQPMLEAPAP